MEHHCHCEVQGVDGGRGGVGCAGGGCAFCFYDLGWLPGCGCHGGHGYPPLDGVDKKSGEVGGLPEARGLAHIASLRLMGITINIDRQPMQNTKDLINHYYDPALIFSQGTLTLKRGELDNSK